MAELTAREPLLLNEGAKHGYSKRKPFLLSLYQWVLKSLMWLLFVTWFSLIVLFPTDLWKNLISRWTTGSVSGMTGSVFLTYSGPILIIAFVAFFYVDAFSRDSFEKKNAKSLRCCIWTFPILVSGPLGVVSVAELIGILIFTAYVLWTVTIYTVLNYRQISNLSLPPKEWSYFMLEHTGLRLGSIGLFCLSFLFLPVARGSVLLRLIPIPFEHATRYHVWLGHLTMTIFTLHGTCYVISWALQGCLLDKEDGKLSKDMTFPSIPISTGGTMSCLVGTGNTVWSGIYIFVSTIGFIIFFGLVEVYYIRPFGVISWRYRGLLFILCMVASIATLGGIVVFMWNQWEKEKFSNKELISDHEKSEPTPWRETDNANLVIQRIQYGCRPDFQEIFSSFSEHVGHDDVGVIACCPPGLQSSVAKECRWRNMRRIWNQPFFHFHSHSFDL